MARKTELTPAVKAISAICAKCLENSDPTVRAASGKVINSLQVVYGTSNIQPLFSKVEKRRIDPIIKQGEAEEAKAAEERRQKEKEQQEKLKKEQEKQQRVI